MSQPSLTLMTAILTTVLLVLWWALLSRARWWARLIGLAVVIGLGWGARQFLEVRGFTGDLVPQVAWRNG